MSFFTAALPWLQAGGPSTVRASGQDLAQDKDLSDYAEAYGPVADELEAVASFVRHSVTLAKNKVGSEALTTYILAQRLSKRPETADLLPHVEDMTKALGRSGRRKAKAQPAPAHFKKRFTTEAQRTQRKQRMKNEWLLIHPSLFHLHPLFLCVLCASVVN